VQAPAMNAFSFMNSSQPPAEPESKPEEEEVKAKEEEPSDLERLNTMAGTQLQNTMEN